MKVCKILFTLLTGICLIVFLTGCKSKNEEELLNDKAKSEIEYLSANFIKVLNNLNNLTFENFDVVVESPTLSKKSASQEKESTSKSSGGGDEGGEQSGENGSNSENQNGTGEQSSKETSDESSNIVTTQMSPNTILNPSRTEIDWVNIKTDIENLHETWNTIVLDLYKLNVNNDNILSFSNDLDKATSYVKNEDKANSILAVAKLYSYLPKYMENISVDNVTKNITSTQSYIINGYSLLDVRRLGWN